MKRVITFLIALTLVVITWDAHCKTKEKKDIEKPEVEYIEELDTLKILPFTETAQVDIRWTFYDKDGNVTRIEEGMEYIFKDQDDDPKTAENETSTAYTDFLNATGIDLDRVYNALEE